MLHLHPDRLSAFDIVEIGEPLTWVAGRANWGQKIIGNENVNIVRRNSLFRNLYPIPAKISGCSPWSRSVKLGSAESEHPKLTNNREIIFEKFQPMWSRQLNRTDGWTDRRTDRRLAVAILRASCGKKPQPWCSTSLDSVECWSVLLSAYYKPTSWILCKCMCYILCWCFFR